MSLQSAEEPVTLQPEEAPPSPWPPCGECGSKGPFGVGKIVRLPAGPTHGVVPVVCRSCGDVRLFPSEAVKGPE